jgi:NAD(P)H dehydrogenase (quinone)
MLMVTGASGNLVKATLACLRTLVGVSQIAVTTRNPDSAASRLLREEGVSVRKADFNDRESLKHALKGVERLYIIPSWDEDAIRFGQHRNVIESAKVCGVSHLVFASFLNAEDMSIVHNKLVYGPTEQALRQSGIAYTNLRNSLFAESLLVGVEKILDLGLVHTSAGATAVAYIARQDVGTAAAYILANGGHENQTYTLTMEKPYGGSEVAATMATVFERPIRYEPLHEEIYIPYIKEWWGIPNAEEYVKTVASSFEAGASGRYNFATGDFQAIVGRPPQNLEQFLRGVKSTRGAQT